ncbi:MAG: hypothetical protein NC821_00810, partial [Candidatus Omnitrophica bacterium]|nr:hypothetical protein [Candidatus Omnitrophota bacterium]
MSDKFKKIIQFGFIILIFVNILSFQRTEEFDYKTFFHRKNRKKERFYLTGLPIDFTIRVFWAGTERR